ncbi:hypothetical protein U0070_017454 [Myodes glareolus]|uniref:MOK n=1 Tax=Myodes glareolus TaxID=447135 RepID=A0AAW0HH81_MYOGA
MKNYKAIGKIGEGTFSEVMKMQSLRDGNYYACKQMKQHFERYVTGLALRGQAQVGIRRHLMLVGSLYSFTGM